MEELIMEMMMRQLSQGGQPVEPPPDPRHEAAALLVSRLAQQDVTDPSSFRGRETSGIERATGLTSFADLGDLINAIERRDPLAVGGTALATLLGLAGGAALGRRAIRGRRALQEGTEEGGEAIGQLRRELRERRSGETGRRGAPREGPQGRRASDEASQAIMAEVEGIVARDILNQAARRAPTQGADPLTELLRLLNPPQ